MIALAILALKLAVAFFVATKLVLLAMAGVFCGAVMRALARTRFGRHLPQRHAPNPYAERRRGKLRQRVYAARQAQTIRNGALPARVERLRPIAWRRLP